MKKLLLVLLVILSSMSYSKIYKDDVQGKDFKKATYKNTAKRWVVITKHDSIGSKKKAYCGKNKKTDNKTK